LIESFPVYLVRAERAGDLAELTGFALAAAEIVPSGMYLDADHPLPPPTYQWLQVHGDADDDFSIGASHTLRVSDRAFARLQRWQLRFCDVQRV
jgi:hypothetical protein